MYMPAMIKVAAQTEGQLRSEHARHCEEARPGHGLPGWI